MEMDLWNGKFTHNGYNLIMWEIVRVKISISITRKYNRGSSGFFSRFELRRLRNVQRLQKRKSGKIGPKKKRRQFQNMVLECCLFFAVLIRVVKFVFLHSGKKYRRYS